MTYRRIWLDNFYYLILPMGKGGGIYCHFTIHCESNKYLCFYIFIKILYKTSKELEKFMNHEWGVRCWIEFVHKYSGDHWGPWASCSWFITLLKLHLLFTWNWFYSVNQIMFLIQFAWLKWLLSLFVIKSNLHKIF